MPLPKPIQRLLSLSLWHFPKNSRGKHFNYLPELFLLMTLVTMGYSLYTMQLYQQMEEMVRFTTWHLQLRKEFALSLFSRTQSLPNESGRILRQLQNNLNTMINGGTITLPADPESIHVPKATVPALKQELLRRLRIYRKIQENDAKLQRTRPQTAGHQAIRHSNNTLLGQLEYPHVELVTLYIKELQETARQLAWLELATVLLITLIGVIMTRQQKLTLQALAESEQRFREIFKISPVGKALVDFNGTIQGVNQALQKLLGYPEAELRQQPIRSLYDGDITDAEKQLYQELLEKKRSAYQIEKIFRHRDGHGIWVLVSVAIMYNIEQEPNLLVLQAQDITELRGVQEALRLSERRYRTIVESAMDGILVANMENVIVSANTQVNRIFGYEPDELTGTRLLALIPPVYREAHLKGMQRVNETHESRLSGKLLELQGLKKNGDTFPLELSLSTWEGGEGSMMATAIIRDITVRKELQREREALILSKKSLEEFTMIAAHDLQEPLRKIAFYTERFSKREEKGLQKASIQDLQRLQAGVARMQDLLRALSEYSRITPQNPEFKPINLNLLLPGINFEIEAELNQAGATLSIDPLPIIEADEAQMQILFKNLIQNALKFRRSGVCPHIHIYGNLIQYQLHSYEVPMLEISVQDNGIGFDEKYLDRIFKVFQRLHTASRFSGTGIGLATCKKIVELHHGHITARSQPGEGSTFIISLPIYQK
ncbi:sensor histidine kinase [Vampirovibrio chlorellavorus]|uniref:sensor histidine kinase n=1 Tax=Vampirovibrio chlorellavorus TaxID=758823 RepID=UPI0026ECA007|nr:PAS domain S-box protein [Vampirovibrio chlorellavorus]